MSYLIPQSGPRPSVSIVLTRPIVHGATRRSALKFTPTEQDVAKFRTAVGSGCDEVETVIELLVSATGLPRSAISQIRASDLRAVVCQVGGGRG